MIKITNSILFSPNDGQICSRMLEYWENGPLTSKRNFVTFLAEFPKFFFGNQ